MIERVVYYSSWNNIVFPDKLKKKKIEDNFSHAADLLMLAWEDPKNKELILGQQDEFSVEDSVNNLEDRMERIMKRMGLFHDEQDQEENSLYAKVN